MFPSLLLFPVTDGCPHLLFLAHVQFMHMTESRDLNKCLVSCVLEQGLSFYTECPWLRPCLKTKILQQHSHTSSFYNRLQYHSIICEKASGECKASCQEDSFLWVYYISGRELYSEGFTLAHSQLCIVFVFIVVMFCAANLHTHTKEDISYCCLQGA